MTSRARTGARWPLVAAVAGSCLVAALAAPARGGTGRSTATLKQIYVGNVGVGAGSSGHTFYTFTVDDVRFKGYAVMNGDGLLRFVTVVLGAVRFRVGDQGGVEVVNSGESYVERHRKPFAQGGGGVGLVMRVGDVTFHYYYTSMRDFRFLRLKSVRKGALEIGFDYWNDPRRGAVLSRASDFYIVRFDYKGPGAGGYRAGRIRLLGNAAIDYYPDGGYRSGRVSQIALLQDRERSPFLVDYFHDAGPRSGRLRSYGTEPKPVTMTVDYTERHDPKKDIKRLGQPDGAARRAEFHNPRINEVTGPTRIAGVEITIQGIKDGTTAPGVGPPKGLVEIHVINGNLMELLWVLIRWRLIQCA